MTVVGTLEAELKADPSQWEAAMKKSIEAMDKMTQKFQDSSRKIMAANRATEEAASSLQKLQASAKDLGERFSRVGAVTSGMGAAFSSAVPQMQGAVAAAAGLAQSFATGGPLLAGLALAGTLFGLLASKISSMRDEAERLAEQNRKAMKESGDAAAASLKSLVEVEREIAKAEAQLMAARGNRALVAAQMDQKFAREDLAGAREKIASEQAAIDKIMEGARRMTQVEARDKGLTGDAMVEATRQKVLNDTERQQVEFHRAELKRAQEILATENKRIDRMEYLVELRKALASVDEGAASQGAGAGPTRSSARTIAELTPLQTQAMNAGDFGLLETLLGEFGTNLEQASGGSLEFARELLRMAEASSDTAARLKEAEKAAKELAEEQDKAAKKAREDAARKLGGQYADVIGAVGSGTVGSLAMTAGLGAAGAAASVALGDPTGMIGGQIGQALGQVLGPVADELMARLGTFGPLMDALGTVVSGLLPVFGFLGAVVGIVANVLDFLAPIVLAVSQVFMAPLVPLLRLTEVVMPLVMIQFGLLMPALELFSDVLLVLVNVLDTYVMRPLATIATDLYNAFADVVNALIGWVNNLGIFGVQLQEMQRMDRPGSMLEMGILNQELIRATDDNTEQLEEFNRSMSNLPAGFRYALAEYRAETPDGRGTPGGRHSMGARGESIVINGPVNVTARNGNILEEIRRNMRQRGNPYAGPAISTPSKRN